jgi:hypothetical protein
MMIREGRNMLWANRLQQSCDAMLIIQFIYLNSTGPEKEETLHHFQQSWTLVSNKGGEWGKWLLLKVRIPPAYIFKHYTYKILCGKYERKELRLVGIKVT